MKPHKSYQRPAIYPPAYARKRRVETLKGGKAERAEPTRRMYDAGSVTMMVGGREVGPLGMTRNRGPW